MASFCGNCGKPLNAGERFCGSCGTAAGPDVGEQVSGGQSSAAASSSRSPMMFVGIAMILVAVFAIGGIVLFGDRLGLAGTSDAPEPARLLESTERSEPTTENEPPPEETPETAGSPTPDESAPESTAFTEPDSAFDSLIPTLQSMTDAPILLPGSLPDEFGGVAIDESTTAESYDILFFSEPQTETVQQFVNAYVGATISAEPGEVAVTDYGSGVTTTRLDDATLPDGTTAIVEYHEAPEAANTNIFATGRFVRDDENGNPHSYVVTVEFDSPEAEWTRELLTSMVFVEDDVTAETLQEVPEEETFEQEFVTRYYDAVAARDWYATYALLAESSQAEFTEAEWVEVQEARVAATNPPPLTDATVQSVTGEAAGFVADILLTYTDGTTETVPIQAVLEEDGLKRYLTADDVSYLRDLTGETSSGEGDTGFEEAVEQFVYEYYAAVEAEDWSQTYSMLDYGGQSAFTESEWIERQQTRQAISGGTSPVVDVSASAPSSYPPEATATVTFADGEVVEIMVVNPHSDDADFDRVLTAEEIAYLQGL